MARYKGDPRWIEAKFAGHCHGKTDNHQDCAVHINTGDRVFYYPQGGHVYAVACGHADENARDFASHAADEDGGCY